MLSPELVLRADLTSIRYRRNQVLSEAHIELHEKELSLLVGPSGEGKTTLMRAIVGDPTLSYAGAVSIHDHDGTSHSIEVALSLGRVACVNPRPFFVNWQSVLENLHLPPRLNKNIKLERLQITALFHRLLLDEEHLFGKPRDLSLGQRFRVGLIRALVRSPRLLLIDEVFTGLDQQTASCVAKFVREYVTTHQCAALAITHRPEMLDPLANAVYSIEKGASDNGSSAGHLVRKGRSE